MHGIIELGGRKSAAAYYFYLLSFRLGAFSRLRNVQWDRVDRLVFVCTGNICRSPFAEVRARRNGTATISCGIEADPGSSADGSAMRVAKAFELDLTQHASQRLSLVRIQPGDLVLALEPKHLAQSIQMVRGLGAQVSLLGLWAQRPIPYIPDPFAKTDRCFQWVFAIVEEAVNRACELAVGARSSSSDR